MQIFATMEKGILVPDEVVIDLLAEAMSKESTGFLVDGFPATMEQAQLFEKTVGSPVKIIVFEMNDELMRVSLRDVATLTTGRMRSGRGLTTTTREPSRLSKLTPSLSSLLMRTRVLTPYFLMCVRSWSRERKRNTILVEPVLLLSNRHLSMKKK